MKIAEIFYSIQGEIDTGKPVVFIRFSGCNLIKESKACKFCDSLWAEEGKEMTLDEVMSEVQKYKCKNIVITGGEPLYHIEDFKNLANSLIEKYYNIDVETNGTIFDDILWKLDNINCSSKKQVLNLDVLKRIGEYNGRFKFVYENKDDLWWEEIIKKLNIDKNNIWIMPEGKTREEQIQKSEEVIEYCKEKGFNFTPRLHTLVWDNKKGV